MIYEDLTEAQREALNLRPRKTAIYEKENTIIDETTGEILRSEHNVVSKLSEEPDYIKVYYKTMLAFANAEGIPLEFVLAISRFITWSNNGSDMRYMNNRPNRDEVCAALNIKDSMYKRYLKRCVDCGLFFPSKYRGCYEVNPFFIARGKWDSISKLQMSLDFVSGKWVRRIGEPERTDSLDPVNPAPQVGDSKNDPGDIDWESKQMNITDYPGVVPKDRG